MPTIVLMLPVAELMKRIALLNCAQRSAGERAAAHASL
jgi:hypothetical protein